ncbi:hypothetical protein B0T25DRAFT_296656 [Lasiosphaeria hispida]|uniref:Uncharacterized protein n=1 Tax=Lasiosphaeria hispida TaxID=260671 RepID=A0AAJ0MBS0_9PEZI|nr:hypothetical protein B0T25DRAFT_296656 [Lasiosphaeria hispida]
MFTMPAWVGESLTFPVEFNSKDNELMLLYQVLCASDICPECQQEITKEFVRLSKMSWSALQLTDEHVYALEMQAEHQDGWGGARDETLVNEYRRIYDMYAASDSQGPTPMELSDSVAHLFGNNGLWVCGADEWAFKVFYACVGGRYTLRDLALGRDYTTFALMHHERVLFAMKPQLGAKCTCVNEGTLYMGEVADEILASGGPSLSEMSDGVSQEMLPSAAFRMKLNALRSECRVQLGLDPEDSPDDSDDSLSTSPSSSFWTKSEGSSGAGSGALSG